MLMFLTILMASVIVLAVSAAVFAGVTYEEQERPEIQPDLKIAMEAPQFFADDRAPRVADSRVPLEVLLSQIDRHVRLEQAAAETFLDVPTAETLHSRTTSPLVH